MKTLFTQTGRNPRVAVQAFAKRSPENISSISTAPQLPCPLIFQKTGRALHASFSSIKYNSNQFLMQTLVPMFKNGRAGQGLLGGMYYVILPMMLLLGISGNSIAATINVPGDQPTISAAVAAASLGDVIVVAPGTYNENVTINKSLTLRSSSGRAVTTIQGSTGLATVLIQANNVILGGIGQGFTIKGYDSPSPGLEYAAVYVQGVRSNVTIRGNEIFADGEAGLLSEVGNAVTNLVVSANIFSGKTFVGAEAGDCGFANQFTAFNVPRQLVVIQTGTGITFTSNQITGTAGSSSSFSGCETTGQGNTLVTIDANNATIRGNTFAGTTTRFGHSLRVRGTGANISCNTFDNAGLGLACVHFFSNATAIAGLGSPNTLAGIASANTFINEGAYFTGATQIYRSSAQVAAIPQTPIAANSTASPLVTNTNTGEIFCSIQSAIDDAATMNGHIITVAAGTYAENITVNKSLDIRGPNYGISPNTGIRGTEAIIVPPTSDPVNGNIVTISASNASFNGFTIDGDNPDIGVAKDALRGVYVSTNGLNNVQVSNNIVKNLEGSGIRFQQATNFFATTGGATFSSDNVIDDNLIQNITSLGVDLRQSMYTKVINNVISNVRYGIYINSFRISDPGNPANRIISGNTIQSRQWGVWFNLYAAAHYETSNNTITAIADATRAKWYGIMLSTVSSPQNALSQLNLPLASTPEKWSLINNSINGSNLDPATSGIGYWLWHVDNNRDNSSNDHYGIISGGSVSNVDIGLYMHNVDTDPTTSFGQGRTGAHASVSNVNFSVNAGGKGIHLKDDPIWVTANIAPLVAKRNVNATINNCYITGGADGVLLEESEDDKVSAPMNNNSITGQTGLAIIATTLNSTVDATCNWYGTAVYGDLPAKMTGNVDYIPYLNNGMDDNVAAGFQPVSGSCIDGPVRVYMDNTETTLLSTHVTIQAGVNAAVNGNVVRVDAGAYNEDVNVNKSVAVKGAGIDQSIVSGPIGGDGATFRVASPGVVIDGFTITRDGNNLTDWNNAGLNFAGVAIQGHANDGEIRNCKIIGNRTGIDINDSDGNKILNNIITFNRTGLLFRNKTDNTIMTENEVTDNWTAGILFIDASSGTNVPVQSALNSQFNNNNISGNWYGQIVDRQLGGSLPAPGTTNMKNFECNWYGTTAPVVSTANSAEPGYAALIPVLYGGTATAPGGQPDILGGASANFDYLLYLVVGTDFVPATPGFQPTPLSCIGGCPGGGVVINTNTSAIFCSIQDAINDPLTLDGHTISVAAGTYSESVVVNKQLTINGPNANIACGSRVAEAVVNPASQG